MTGQSRETSQEEGCRPLASNEPVSDPRDAHAGESASGRADGAGEDPAAGGVPAATADALAALDAAVRKQPLNREIMRKALAYCLEERALHDVEQEIQTYPEYPHCTQNPYRLIMTLVFAGGLETIERDEKGAVVTEADKEGLTEDEVDDLVAQTSFRATETGRAYVAETAPEGRIEALYDEERALEELFGEVLSFIGEETRSYPEIEARFKGRADLERIIEGQRESMQPSVLVDKLERAGAIVFDGGWRLTEAGRGRLAQEEESASAAKAAEKKEDRQHGA